MPRRTRREQPSAGKRQKDGKRPRDVAEIAGRVVGKAGLQKEGYIVRNSLAPAKRYRCPYCEGWIEPAVAHVVVYPVGKSEERRHYHSPCWSRQTAGRGG